MSYKSLQTATGFNLLKVNVKLIVRQLLYENKHQKFTLTMCALI